MTLRGRSTPEAGNEELADLIDMILAQPECSKFICRKLYQWFVGATITPEIETSIIVPLATTFRNSNFEIKPVLTQLLSSTHFYEDCLRGGIIKHPLDFVLNMIRLSNVALPNRPNKTLTHSRVFDTAIRSPSSNMLMQLMNHPTVFGWDAYYQSEMYKLWINANLIRIRSNQVNLMINGFKAFDFTFKFEPIELTETLLADGGYTFANKDFPDSTDTTLADKIIEAYCFYCYPRPCTDLQKTNLKEDLLLQGTLNEIGFWFEWKYYKDGDVEAQNGLKTRLYNLIKYFWQSSKSQPI